jgi:lauroyl/myristoyl acyltransferase
MIAKVEASSGTQGEASASPISINDIIEVPRLAMQGLMAWILPEMVWWPVSRTLGRINALTHPQRNRSEVAQVEAVAGDTTFAARSDQIPAENWANRYEERFQYLRAWRPYGWRPCIDISGSDRVDAARRQGRGIVFWAGNFSFNDLVTKMAWHQLSMGVSHFSRPQHGFSATRFGIRYLNAVRRGVEDRYLRERIMVTEQETGKALQLISRRLEEGYAVSFTVGNRGRRKASAKFLGGRLTVAIGPLFLAHNTGATLLPVFTLRKGPGQFEVTIGEAIDVSGSQESDYAAAVQTYADVLAPYVLRDPGQWRGWRYTSER